MRISSTFFRAEKPREGPLKRISGERRVIFCRANVFEKWSAETADQHCVRDGVGGPSGHHKWRYGVCRNTHRNATSRAADRPTDQIRYSKGTKMQI